jgi:hypothetical protein
MRIKLASVIAIGLLTIGCITVPYENLKETSSNGSTFVITRQTYNSLTGNLTVYAYPIYFTTPGFSSSNDIITLTKMSVEDGTELYSIVHTYQGSDWRFMKKMIIKIDDKLIELQDQSPDRTVGFPVAGMVQERLTYEIGNSVIESLSSCSTIQLQYYGELVSVKENDLYLLKSAIQKMRDLSYVPKN